MAFMKLNWILNLIVLIIIIALIIVPIENADPENSTFESTPGIVYENAKGNTLSEIMKGFGLLMATLLIAVLIKAIFDYIRIRNQSLLINY